MGLRHPGLPLRLRGSFGQRHRRNRNRAKRKNFRHAGRNDVGAIGPGFLPTHKEIGGGCGEAIEHAGNSIAADVRFPRHQVLPHKVGLEEGPHLVIVGLLDGIVFVIMALGAVHRQAEKALADMLDRFIEPLMAVEDKITAGEIAGGTELGGIVGIEFVGGEHLPHHLVVGDICIERFHDPVAPVPDVLLAVAMFLSQPPPIAVAPHIHPVAAPALAVAWIGQQPIGQLLIPVGGGGGFGFLERAWLWR